MEFSQRLVLQSPSDGMFWHGARRQADMSTTHSIPSARLSRANDLPPNPGGAYVLYWMTSARRLTDNFGLEHAISWSRRLGRPLLIFEALRCDYPWASARHHRFILDGMAANRGALAAVSGVRHYAYVEPSRGHGAGLLAALAASACVVVTDHFPCFFLPRMIASAAQKLPVSLEVVDSNGIMPLSTAPKVFTTAFSFRRHLHKNVLDHLEDMPQPDPLGAAGLSGDLELPSSLLDRWPEASPELLGSEPSALARLPIDHEVEPTGLQGGAQQGLERAARFVESRLGAYPSERNEPESPGGSGLSPFLHFGHLSVHSVMRMLMEHEGWTPERVAPKPTGSRGGWWGMSEAAEAFIDELVTWREVGYTFGHLRPHDYDAYESLPSWALETLEEHADDPREHVYERTALEAAETHDELWNAAQRQLVAEGRIHGYLRMLWGKKILEWSEHPRVALAHLIELNNKYALDGRNPNSYSGIFWTLGRFDRAWGPERPIFGKIRYMSSANTARKVRVRGYLARWSGAQPELPGL